MRDETMAPADGVKGEVADASRAPNSASRVLFASLIGTTIEYFDFYIFGTAAVLVFPQLFFPGGDPTLATLQSLATFGLAFVARPVGSALFGHFGDRIGRKATLVASLLTMGLSTVFIGLLPSYAAIGIAAPILLAVLRFGQGLGLGGEWGGAVLLATENAPPSKRAWYGMFPQLGGPAGFFLSGSVFLVLTTQLPEADFLSWGWRIPFIASALLVVVGLYVRLNITETPEFRKVLARQERVKVPMIEVVTRHPKVLALATLAGMGQFVLFYLITVFTLSWATSSLGYARADFLVLQLISVVFFAGFIPLAAKLSDSRGHAAALTLGSAGLVVFGLVLGSMLQAGSLPTLIALSIGMALMGMCFGPLGTLMAALFPAEVRYTGA
ncbi:MAG: MHS family MFS transporter, partial [Burkholderiaceae bacterium]|nr:MHS family MFS transporter [Burkholderiaceae bacterium]